MNVVWDVSLLRISLVFFFTIQTRDQAIGEGGCEEAEKIKK